MLSQESEMRLAKQKAPMQGAQMSSNEAYLRTSKQREQLSYAAVGEFLRRHQI